MQKKGDTSYHSVTSTASSHSSADEDIQDDQDFSVPKKPQERVETKPHYIRRDKSSDEIYQRGVNLPKQIKVTIQPHMVDNRLKIHESLTTKGASSMSSRMFALEKKLSH